MSEDPLLQPYQLKHLTLRNRVMMTAHEPAYPEDGMPKGRYRAYHEERAKGGVALTMTAGSAVVSRDSPPSFNNILAYKDEVVGWMRELADACHAHGTAVMIQLTHLGRRTRWDKGDWLPSLSSTLEREPAHRGGPKLAEDWDIERIVADYADAAGRMKDAGLDGVEIEAYGHLLDGFWSPLTNTRTDQWGAATLENRMRMSMDVLRAIRDRVGPGFIVGVRFIADEDEEGGIGPQEGLRIAGALKDSGLVDFFNVIRGRIHSDPALTKVIPIQGMASAPHLDFAGAVRKTTGLPTFHAARIGDVATARHAVANGLLDMVGMTRAHITDPHIVRKITQGREHEIRPCVGANYCLDRIYQGGSALCIHNPSTGRERELPHEIERATAAQHIVIVGAGPGGLEAARVAALRGHRVTVFEAAPEAGGQIRLAVQSKRRREMIGIVDWRLEQCRSQGVVFHFSTVAEASDVLSQDPDTVVIATGGLPMGSRLEAGSDLTITSWDILSGDVAPAARVLVYDEAGDAAGLQAAEKIAETGAHVEVMTPDRTFAPEVMGMNLVPFITALQKHDARLTVTYRLSSVERKGNALSAVIGTDYSNHRERREFDQIVLNNGTFPLDDLYFELKHQSRNLGAVSHKALVDNQGALFEIRNPAGTFNLYRIGDAVSARNTHAAIYDAIRYGRFV